MAIDLELDAAHPEAVSWDEHVEELGRVRAELTAENMRLEALLDDRNREIESLSERLPQPPDAPAAPQLAQVVPELFRFVDANMGAIEVYAAEVGGFVLTVETADPSTAPDHLYYGPTCDLAFKARARDLSSGSPAFESGWMPATSLGSALAQAADQLQAVLGDRLAQNRSGSGRVAIPERSATRTAPATPLRDASRATAAARAQRPTTPARRTGALAR